MTGLLRPAEGVQLGLEKLSAVPGNTQGDGTGPSSGADSGLGSPLGARVPALGVGDCGGSGMTLDAS